MYNYKTQRANIFTDEGQRMFLRVRDQINQLLTKSGAVRMQEAIANISGDSWDMIACVDRLIELDELREIGQADVTQHRVFISK